MNWEERGAEKRAEPNMMEKAVAEGEGWFGAGAEGKAGPDEAMQRLYIYADGVRIAVVSKKLASNTLDTQWILSDHLGSSSVTADTSGGETSRTLYQAWGTIRSTTGTVPTDYGFTGQMAEGEVYYYKARWYDPRLGRFMQADSLVPAMQGTQGFDRYAYVNNNPVKYTDPSGNMLWEGDGGGNKKNLVDIIIAPLKENYSWKFAGKWNYHEAHEVKQASAQIAKKIDSMGGDGNKWITTYLSNVTFVKTSQNHSFQNPSYTDLLDAIGVTFPNSTITFSSTYKFDKPIVIHELGHAFDNYFGPKWNGGAAVFGNGLADQLYTYVGGVPSGIRCTGNIFNKINKSSLPANNYGWNSQADFFAQHFMYQFVEYPSPEIYSQTNVASWMETMLKITIDYIP
ncbi:MAG: RHS repeat-associated core domain-containing protein [Angelakisella sp.]|nr:RHS repeat-associated core domain-containing protein [Angelakisella sp.]